MRSHASQRSPFGCAAIEGWRSSLAASALTSRRSSAPLFGSKGAQHHLVVAPAVAAPRDPEAAAAARRDGIEVGEGAVADDDLPAELVVLERREHDVDAALVGAGRGRGPDLEREPDLAVVERELDVAGGAGRVGEGDRRRERLALEPRRAELAAGVGRLGPGDDELPLPVDDRRGTHHLARPVRVPRSRDLERRRRAVARRPFEVPVGLEQAHEDRVADAGLPRDADQVGAPLRARHQPRRRLEMVLHLEEAGRLDRVLRELGDEPAELRRGRLLVGDRLLLLLLFLARSEQRPGAEPDRQRIHRWRSNRGSGMQAGRMIFAADARPPRARIIAAPP
jgi:hypothetical protein